MTGPFAEDVSAARHSFDDDELAPAEKVLAELGDYLGTSSESDTSDESSDSDTSDESSDSDTSDELSDSDTSSDSDSDVEMDIDSIREGTMVDEGYVAQLGEPKDLDIILSCRGEPGNVCWTAQAPEFRNAFGWGSSIEKASEQLQSNLVYLKQSAIEEHNLDATPLNSCTRDARNLRMGWQNGHTDARAKAYWDQYYEEGSIALVWGKIRV